MRSYQIDKGLANPAQAVFLNKERLNGLRSFGGVRIEDVRPTPRIVCMRITSKRLERDDWDFPYNI